MGITDRHNCECAICASRGELLDMSLRQSEEYNGKHQIACLEIERLKKEIKELADDCRNAVVTRVWAAGGDRLNSAYERIAGYLDRIGRTNG